MRAKNAMINRPFMLEKVNQLRWRSAIKISSRHRTIKIASQHQIYQIFGWTRRRADQGGAENSIKNVLPGPIEGYDQNDIFNADETELHHRVLSPSPAVILLVVKRQKIEWLVQFYGNRKEGIRN